MAEYTSCGTDCSQCSFWGNLCQGCRESKGRVFHAPEGRACALYECAVEEKKLKDCGQCLEVPCHIWKETRDPSYTDDEFEKSIQERIANLKGREER